MDILQNYVFKDGAEAENLRIKNSASAPSTPYAGMFWFDTNTNTPKFYNGSSFVSFANGGTVALTSLEDNDTTAGLPLLSGGAGGDPNYAAVDLSGAGATGYLAAGRFPALSGDLSGTNGSLSVTVSQVGGAAAADIADAVTKRHTQGTDTGTTATDFQVDSDNSGPRLKHNGSGELAIRNSADSGYAPLRVGDLIVEGTQVILNSETFEVADNNFELNSNITSSTGNSDGGLTVRRFETDAAGSGTISSTGTAVTGSGSAFTTEAAVGDYLVFGAQRRKITVITSDTALTIESAFSPEPSGDTYSIANRSDAKFYFDQSTGLWKVTDGATGDLTTSQVARKASFTVGNGSDTDIVLTHNLGTRDVAVEVYRNTSPYDKVVVDNERTSVDSVTLKFLSAPTSNQYKAVVTG